jgi:phosphonate transport system substrate-binding protein
MMRRNLLAGALAAAASLALAACSGGGDEGQAPPSNTVNFSILSTENAQNLEVLWEPFLADMRKATGLEVKPFYGSNYTALIEAMRFGQVQVGWFSNQSGLEAVRRADAEVFARSSDVGGVDGYNSILIVARDSPLTIDDVLKCDKALSFGIGDAKSTSGTLAPMTYLFAPRNIDPQDCFRVVRSASHQTNLLAVGNGSIDVATNNTTNVRRLARSNPGQGEKVRVIWTSPRLPEDPIVWRKDLDPEIKTKVRDFFMTYGTGTGPEAERQKAILASLDFGVFRPSDNSHLLPVREMEATEQLLQAKNTGDQAKVAAAQATLDAVKRERAALSPAPAASAASQ